MKSLFIFLYKFRAFITLVLLETICGFLIVQNSQYHRALFFNSSNATIGNILSISSNVTQYFQLRKINEQLASENAALKNELHEFESRPDSLQYDSIRGFNFIYARVVNNSVDLRNNLITINIGAVNGVKEDMGVISNGNVVGKTRYVSENYSIVTSLLHTESMIPAMIKGKVNIATAQWDGTDPYFIDLLFVPRHYEVNVGDSIMTSGYGGIFPKDIQLGTISEVNLSEDAPFFDIKVKLATDFYNLAFVEVAQDVELAEIDSLQSLTQ